MFELSVVVVLCLFVIVLCLFVVMFALLCGCNASLGDCFVSPDVLFLCVCVCESLWLFCVCFSDILRVKLRLPPEPEGLGLFPVELFSNSSE